MAVEYITGFIICFVLIAVIAMAKRGSDRNISYDEMQLRIRGDGYKVGFTTLLISLVLFIFYYAMELPGSRSLEPALGLFLALMIGLVTFAVYCINKDAFFGVGQNGKRYITLCALIVVINVISAVSRFMEGEANETGTLSFSRWNSPIMAVGFGIILISLLAKSAGTKDEADE